MSARHRAGTGHVDRNAGPAPVPVLARPDYGGAPAPFGAPRGREARLPTASRNPLRRPATIRGRMARMLVLPVVGMLVLFGILVSRESDEYLETNAVSQEVRLSLTVQNMIHELQRERGLTAGLLGGDTRFRPDLVEQRRQTDDALRRGATGIATVGHGTCSHRRGFFSLRFTARPQQGL